MKTRIVFSVIILVVAVVANWIYIEVVCGVQAAETVNKYIVKISEIGTPLLFVPHPAARNLTNIRCEEIREEIKRIGEQNHD